MPMTEHWNDEPPVHPSNWLHFALIGLHALTRIPSFVLVLLVVALAALTGLAWHAVAHVLPPAIAAGGLYMAAVLGDWAWLVALPRLNISFGPVKPSLIGLIGVRLAISLLPLAGGFLGMLPWGGLLAGLLIHVAASVAILYATRIEPFHLGITRLELATDKLAPGRRVRLVQVSDIHVERITQRERALIEKVNQLDADYLLLTGDYLNFSYIGEPKAIADCRQVLSALRARAGIYAVRGTHQVDPNVLLPQLFDGLPICWLRSEHVTIGQDGTRMTLAGASCSRERAIDVPALRQALADIPSDQFIVLLYHTPDLAAEAEAQGVDLYLAGHTHGGQIRLPFYGALMTGTDSGKKYEMGRYQVGNLVLYVSRGIGMEGMAAPRARFLCPPEIVCIDVIGQTRK